MLVGFISLVFFVFSAAVWSGAVSVHRSVGRLIAVLMILSVQVILVGQCLSLVDQLANPVPWVMGSFAMLVMSGVAWKTGAPFSLSWWPDLRMRAFLSEAAQSSRYTRTVLWMLSGTLFTALSLNIFSICTALPYNWDSVASHLSRAAYYLQFGNMKIFHANYWAHDGHPHNGAILWSYVLGILDSERLTQAIQFLAYLGAGLAAYGLGRELGRSSLQAGLGALIFLLLVENILESTTVQNDMLQAFFSGGAVYFLVLFARSRDWVHAACSLAGMCLAAGVKASFVMQVPVWGVCSGYAFLKRGNRLSLFKGVRPKWIAAWLVFIPLALLFWGDGIGYWQNYRAYGYPFGPEIARRMSFEQCDAKVALVEGSKNLLRYGFDFVSLDGLNHVPGVSKAEVRIKRWVLDLVRRLGIDIESGFMYVPFSPTQPTSDEDFSWWGVMGVLLTPVGIGLALGRKGNNRPLVLVLFVSGLLFILAQAYIGPYKPWRGRYFIFLSLLWAPFLSEVFFAEPLAWPGKGFGLSVVSLGCLSALLCVLLRDARPIGHWFGASRIEQLTMRAKDPDFRAPFTHFEELVPQDATVLLCLFPDTYEYLYFGQKRTRTILPIRKWRDRPAAFDPPDYLVYHYMGNPSLHLCPPREEDVALGGNTFLRKLSRADVADLLGTGEPIAALESYVNGLGMAFRRVPAGCFMMGSDRNEPGSLDNETPHEVCISSRFYMQTTEVTQAQWTAVMDENPAFHEGCPDCPAENVSWDDIQGFIMILNRRGEGGYRLPTEAEWEYAARSGKETAFSDGPVIRPKGPDRNLERVGWYIGNAGGSTRPVASLKPNAWGLFDMHGNVWEWCQDRYGPYGAGPVSDPTGPPTGEYRVARGGSFDNAPSFCRSAARNAFPPMHKGANLGFRLVYEAR